MVRQRQRTRSSGRLMPWMGTPSHCIAENDQLDGMFINRVEILTLLLVEGWQCWEEHRLSWNLHPYPMQKANHTLLGT
jgi:hypothetical protein